MTRKDTFYTDRAENFFLFSFSLGIFLENVIYWERKKNKYFFVALGKSSKLKVNFIEFLKKYFYFIKFFSFNF